MPKQNFSNHVRYYPAHHFIFYPLLLVALIASAYAFNHIHSEKMVWLAIITCFFFIGWLAFMMRQHYALGNQNRIVRLELRLRYFILTGKRFEPQEARLTFSQLAALRFASDDELLTLIDRAQKENLSGTEIKKRIVNWQTDDMRV